MIFLSIISDESFIHKIWSSNSIIESVSWLRWRCFVEKTCLAFLALKCERRSVDLQGLYLSNLHKSTAYRFSLDLLCWNIALRCKPDYLSSDRNYSPEHRSRLWSMLHYSTKEQEKSNFGKLPKCHSVATEYLEKYDLVLRDSTLILEGKCNSSRLI